MSPLPCPISVGLFFVWRKIMNELTEVKNIQNFEELYKWICKQKIDAKDRRILYELTDKVCELNFRGGSY